MGLAEGDIAIGGGIYPDDDYVLLGYGASGAVVWFRVVRHFRGNGQDGGVNTHSITLSDHGEEVEESKKT